MKTYLSIVITKYGITSKVQKSITYSVASGAFLSVMNTQLVRIVSITKVLKSECVNIRIAKRRKQLNGESMKKAGVVLNRNIV